MCRNHRGFVDAVVACSKLGANALFLNTAFSGPQLADVAKREKPKALIYDQEFGSSSTTRRAGASATSPGTSRTAEPKDPPLEDLIARGDPRRRDPAVASAARRSSSPPARPGTPKGASRSQPKSLDPAAALLRVIPLKAREKTMIAAPMFHSWGFAHFTLGMSLSSTLVLKRKFDPEATLSLTAQHGCTALVVVPVMMQRILELPDEVLDRYDLSKRQGRPGVRLGAARAIFGPLDGPVRRQPLQPLRLDRGRVGDDRHAARTCAPRPARPAARRAARS